MFVFQACYGTPQDFGNDVLLQGQVKSKTSGEPIKGIKVSVAESVQYEMTDESGHFSFYTAIKDKLTLRCQDVDSLENGLYLSNDTVLNAVSGNTFIEIKLEEK